MVAIQDRKVNVSVGADLFEGWLEDLDPGSQESFQSFAKENYSLIECFLYARFLGYTKSILDC